MADLTLTTELKAVNTILSGIGEQPIASLPSSYYMATLAQAKLAEVSKAVQTPGLHCNTQTELKLTPDPVTQLIDFDVLVLGSGMLSVDGTYPSVNVTERDRKLFDLDNQTYYFTQPVYVDIVFFLDFEQLPEVIRYYITVRATREFQKRWLGSDALDSFTQEEELRAWAAVQRIEMRNFDRTMSYTTPVSKILNRRF